MSRKEGWVKLKYSIRDHPRVAQLTSNTALNLYLMGIAYAGENLTDGALKTDEVALLLPRRMSRAGVGGAVKQLVAAGLWERVEGGYQIRDYTEHQRSRAEVLSNRANARKGGRASGQTRRSRSV